MTIGDPCGHEKCMATQRRERLKECDECNTCSPLVSRLQYARQEVRQFSWRPNQFGDWSESSLEVPLNIITQLLNT